MELERYEKSLAVIRFDDDHQIVFTDIVNTNVGGYKYVTVSAKILEVIKKERKKKGSEERSRHQIYVKHGFVAKVDLSDLDKEAETKIIKPFLPHLKKMLEKYIVDGILPYEAIENFPKELEVINSLVKENMKKLAEKKTKKEDKEKLKKDREQKKKEREQRKKERDERRKIREEKKSAREIRRKVREEKK